MKGNKIVVLFGCVLLCIGVLATLYAISPMNKEIYRGNFERNFLTEELNLHESLSQYIKFNSYYIAGVTNKTIYLGNWTSPFHVLAINSQKQDTQHIQIKSREFKGVNEPNRFRLKIDSPFFYLYHGVEPTILRGKTDHWIANYFIPNGEFFDQAIPISPTSSILRSFSNSTKENEIAKESILEPNFKYNTDILQKQIDGLLCVDGQIMFNKELNRIIYLYSYRNEYTIADTNINIIHRANTIDTFRHVQIKIARTDNNKVSTLASPPVKTNGESSTFGKYLYIQSNILDRNESKETFMTNITFDVYDIQNGKYSHSFKIPKYKNYELSDFEVCQESLVTIFGPEVVVYKMNKL